MPLNATMRAVITAIETSANDFGQAEYPLTMDYGVVLTDGTGAGQANRLFVDERTVASATADAVDLAAGSGNARPLGGLLTLTQIVGLLIINRPRDPEAAANTTALTIGAGSNPITGLFGNVNDVIVLQPGAFIFLGGPSATPLATVTATTGDILTVTNAAGAANTYQLIVIGRQ